MQAFSDSVLYFDGLSKKLMNIQSAAREVSDAYSRRRDLTIVEKTALISTHMLYATFETVNIIPFLPFCKIKVCVATGVIEVIKICTKDVVDKKVGWSTVEEIAKSGAIRAADCLSAIKIYGSKEIPENYLVYLKDGCGMIETLKKVYLIYKRGEELSFCYFSNQPNERELSTEIDSTPSKELLKNLNDATEYLNNYKPTNTREFEELKNWETVDYIPEVVLKENREFFDVYKCAISGNAIRFMVQQKNGNNSIYYEKKEIIKWFKTHAKKTPPGWQGSMIKPCLTTAKKLQRQIDIMMCTAFLQECEKNLDYQQTQINKLKTLSKSLEVA